MEQGQRYDEAVANIPEYGHHSQLHKVGAGVHKYLPPFYKERDKTGRMVFNDDMDIPRNPVGVARTQSGAQGRERAHQRIWFTA